MHVTLATISLATREAAAPTRWESLCCEKNKKNKRCMVKEEREITSLMSEEFRERMTLTLTVCTTVHKSRGTKPLCTQQQLECYSPSIR